MIWFRARHVPLALVLSGAPLAGCSSAESSSDSDADKFTAGSGAEGATESTGDSGDGEHDDSGADEAGTSTGSSDGGGTSGASTTGGTGTTGDDGDSGDSTTGDPDQLAAAEWRDLDEWPFWRDLFHEDSTWYSLEAHWQFFTAERIPVIVRQGDDRIGDLLVELVDDEKTLWSSRTDNLGRAELFAAAFGGSVQGSMHVQVHTPNEITVVDDVIPSITPIEVDLPVAPHERNALDLMFLVDTTWTMDEELAYLQTRLPSVLERVQSLADGDLDLRLSVNFYRDDGDDYVVLAFPFTRDLDDAIAQLQAQTADGGGDFPEAVELGLSNAVDEHEWRTSARARLLFVVLDAPPRRTLDNIDLLQSTVASAAAQGIRIIPVAAEGTDRSTEFLLRFIDVATGGSFVFLTPTLPNTRTDPNLVDARSDTNGTTVGDYVTENLDDLLVRMITSAAIDG